MARKRKSSGNKDNMPEEKEVEPRSSHSSERVEEQSDCANPLTEKVDALVEKVNSQPSKEANTTKSYSRKKKMKYQVAIVPNKEHSDCANPLTEKVDALVEKVNSQPIKEANTTKSYSQTKKMKYQVATVRRSGRINNTVVTAQNQDIELVTEEVILGESQKEDGQVNVEKQLPRLTTEEKGMEEKIDYISRLLEAQGKNMEEMISKEPRRDSGSNSRNKGYKGLYITSQNKVDALTKENHRLLLKLENALAKLEGVCSI
ncbi:uncharacterized protein LOC21407783 isoform X2 [Morus notabilis]|uniref:uncharacterized protein LOC21407783 isoform X2 n=1 Tax=Morus notabilis TaxID=981085 RepID=UPI000CECED58|nr:uncharacterized protein LOC21407783 isoform X2 [Morus notabilis]